jgi:cobalt-zinc-cadmium efflux system membrane fusion protein
VDGVTMNKNQVQVIAGVLAGLAVGLVIDGHGSAGKPLPAAAKAQPASATPRQVKLSSELAARGQLKTMQVAHSVLSPSLSLVGSVNFDADAVADVGGRIDGRITRMHVSVGDRVNGGDALVEIESRQLGEAMATWLSARANLIAAEHHEQRQSDLGEKQLASAPVVERARAEAEALRAEVAGTEQRLLAMGLTKHDLSGLAQGHGPRRITLRAPIAGEVVERFAVLGQVVDPTQPVMRIADLGKLWIELDVFERDLAHVAVGDQVEIMSEMHPGRSFKGAVAYVDATIDVLTRAAPVRIEVQNPERLLRPGQFVRARLSTQGEQRQVLNIPRRAVMRVEGEPVVFVASGPDTYLARNVELGPTVGDQVEVRRGLADGDVLVTDGAFVLKSELER